jgi:hypothetical protein
MRANVTALRPFLVKATREAREKLAGELFALDHVRELVEKAAIAGQASVRLTQQAPLDLRNTDAAAKLEAWAAAEKLRVEWPTRMVVGQDGRDLVLQEALVSWEEAGGGERKA